MSDDQTLQERLEDLEVRYVFQQQTIEALDEVVRELFARFDELQRSHEELMATLSAPDGEEASLSEQVPPHY